MPPGPIRERRDLTRFRTALMQERTRAANRVHNVLEDAGIKLPSVASHVLAVSGRAMLDALVAGTTDPAVVADLARGQAAQDTARLAPSACVRISVIEISPIGAS